ncbi:uncharacterized protein B0H64DRAFT_438024 [Chaetomium fimeti]|uniref:Uncharacterized protein n=1 Tax=Chaetomium fimeti TaxID=1854472 RepID=A0AAE0HR62_9PEZI|nr:hypothetical protein B0H64DRAFT_438024 [Chaetomium fimeti]
MSDRRPQCTICGDDFDEGVQPVCHNDHAWCRGCIAESIETAIRNVTDAACMPPRCCGDPVLPVEGLPVEGDDVDPDQQQHPALRLLGPAARAS